MNGIFKVGDFVTVDKWISRQDRGYVGDVLEIKAINDPFIVVERYHITANVFYAPFYRFTLNTKEVALRGLTQDFVEAYLGRKIVIPTVHKWQNLIDFIKAGDFKGKKGVRFGKPCADLTELQEFLFKNGYSWCFTGSESVKSYPSEMTLNHNENRTYLVNSNFSSSDYLYYNPDLCQFVEEKPVLVPWTREDVPMCILRHRHSQNKYTVICAQLTGVTLLKSDYSYTYQTLLDDYEYSTDLKTWNPCGKESK